jgi:hypothetical protein
VSEFVGEGVFAHGAVDEPEIDVGELQAEAGVAGGDGEFLFGEMGDDVLG